MNWPRLLLCAVPCALAFGGVAAEPQLLHEESAGVLEVRGESELEIDGLQGEIHLRVGSSGALRYEARAGGDHEIDQPVALWLDGSVLHLTGIDPEQTDHVLLEVAVPPGLDIDFRVADSTVSARSLEGDFTLKGERVRLDVFDLRGSGQIEVQGGDVKVSVVASELVLEGSDIRAELSQINGTATVNLQGGFLSVEQSAATLEGHLEGTVVRGDAVGAVDLDVDEGRVEITKLVRGGRLRLTDTELVVGSSRGVLEVETDAAVQFQGVDKGLRILSHGGSVVGGESAGEIHIETSGAEVVLQKLQGPVTVVGDGLTLRVEDSGAPLTVQVTSSEVIVEKAKKSVRVENDFGDVTIHEASEQVHVVSRNGSVRATRLSGPIDLRADGYEVEVDWAELGAGDSFVENAGGSVRVSIPASAQCQVRATASSGVRSEFDSVIVSADGNSARGSLNEGRSPTIEIRSGEGVELISAR